MRNTDRFDHYRAFYGVPAMRGVIVIYQHQYGVIKGAAAHLHVLMDGEKQPIRVHPNELRYLPTQHQLDYCGKKHREYWAMAYPERPYPEGFQFQRIVEVLAA